jgi:hypothetical protein
MRDGNSQRERHAASNTAATTTHHTAKETADQRRQSLVDANRCAAAARHDADLQPSLLMDQRKVQAAT